jgi:hypothetical protein
MDMSEYSARKAQRAVDRLMEAEAQLQASREAMGFDRALISEAAAARATADGYDPSDDHGLLYQRRAIASDAATAALARAKRFRKG